MTVLAGWEKMAVARGFAPTPSRVPIAGPAGGRNEDIKNSLYPFKRPNRRGG
jgi:hypothetical protein